jgi:amino acid adenylation domain-containing protein
VVVHGRGAAVTPVRSKTGPPASWFATARPFPQDLRVHDLVAAAAARFPERPALVTADGVEYTHGELDEAARLSARVLSAHGVRRGAYVGLFSDHHPEAVRGLLGVLHAGAAYVPLDTRWPVARLAEVLGRAGAAHLLTDRAHEDVARRLRDLVPGLHTVLVLDDERCWPEPHDEQTGDFATHVTPDDIAYCIFTSGSTGAPKGVVVQHRAVVNLIDWVNREFSVDENDRLLFVTSFAFDLSVYDMFGVLAAGGSVHVVPDDVLADPDGVLEVLASGRITFWDSAPAAMAYVLAATAGRPSPRRPSLRRVFLSGDWVPLTMPERIRRFFPGAGVVALGGATEATVWSNSFRIGEVDPDWPSVPYGRPMQNARYHVLDADLRPCPIEVAGDLYIAGDCLGLGYLGDAATTAVKFLPDPFQPGRMYRTGDRARWLPDGNLQFLGRLDHQVKIRGYRIELGEIEAAMARHRAVQEAAVAVRETGSDKELVGCYTCGEEAVDPVRLRAHLEAVLPPYMVPGELVRLNALPTTANGKVDRAGLLRTARGLPR